MHLTPRAQVCWRRAQSCWNRLRPFADRIALAAAIVLFLITLSIVVTTQQNQGTKQAAIETAQRQIEKTQKDLKSLVKRIDAQTSAAAITRVEAVDQRCTTGRLYLELLDVVRISRRLSAKIRSNQRYCLEIRDRYVAALTPEQLAEYRQRVEENIRAERDREKR